VIYLGSSYLFKARGKKMKKEDAVKAFGSIRKLAEALGLSVQAVHQWPDDVPQLRVYQIRELMQKGEA
jgi:hypothetical protein